jgi:hypothetical protein
LPRDLQDLKSLLVKFRHQQLLVKRIDSGAPCRKEKGKTEQERRQKTQTILAKT